MLGGTPVNVFFSKILKRFFKEAIELLRLKLKEEKQAQDEIEMLYR